MSPAGHREPYESRGSRTVLGARGGEIPPRDSTAPPVLSHHPDWRGRPLTDRLAVVELIGATTTRTGLKVECALDPRTYEKGVKLGDAEMAALNLDGDDFHPEWNYSIRPRNQPES